MYSISSIYNGHHSLALLSLLLRQIACFAVPPQFLVPRPSLLKFGTRCPGSLALLCTVVVVVVVKRIERAALVARCWLRAHHISIDDVQFPLPSSASSFLDSCGYKLVLLVLPLMRTRLAVSRPALFCSLMSF